ncbi:hypothetical protein [Roseovarius aestuarii]|uniref:Uncharacterized protein n=1 Tax=Roseovarius aestuarii TaxID=475083 RepID=A0A1X7BTN9_9RHOB|nr:hypothetical protein [Roseovarius aestuarii]SMC12944.1 hypothetical protein ROA7745_02777 [Roseovarius aestuarii]
MPLEILLPLVIFGIAGIAVLLHQLGLSAPTKFEDEAAAEAAWSREFPEDKATHVRLCRNKKAALIETPQGKGIVWAIGADTTARYLTGARIVPTSTGLRIDLPDVTAPHIALALKENEAAAWIKHLKEPA